MTAVMHIDVSYTHLVSVVPKEYTADTKTSVFFGTNEIPLELNGIKYTGEATLPLSEDYAGNVTFLFVDGNKRSTEAVSYTHLLNGDGRLLALFE